MGGLFARADFEVIVKTGDVKGAGTNATVYCALIDSNGNRTKDIKLDVLWRDDFEKGNIDTFSVKNEPNLGDIVKVELWRDEKGIADDWFVEYVKIRKLTKEGKDDGEIAPFPFNRWVAPNQRITLLKYDSVLPQFDERSDQRKKELADKKKSYAFGERSENTPRRVASLPPDEKFSNEYQWDIAAKKIKLLAHKELQTLFASSKWDSLADLTSVYKGPFKIPYGQYNWKSDASFGQQRLRGCSPANVKICKEIPENFAVTDEMISPILDGMTIEEAIAKKQLYIVDLEILHEIACKGENKICCPIALFREKDGELLPLAIQLTQVPGDDNPVFLPTDPEYTWMLAKMFYNNAECSLHQACTHLGFTHLVCESVAVCVHQTLSPSHPVFRLIAPHFLYLLAINNLAVEKLLSVEGWIDTTMTMGVKGLFEILRKKWKQWRFDVNGWLPNELKSRGVDDGQSLSGYLYRNDAMLLHDAICNYVTDVLKYVYDSPEKLQNDYEVQEFAALLVDEENGAGIKGVFGNGKFESLDDLIKVIAGTIFIGSVAHAAANFCQYDEYAFPANFPAYVNGTWPTDKRERTEQDILNVIPNRDMTLSIMVVTMILSDRGTNGLGDFEVQYQYEPHAVAAVEKFRKELDAISQKINERNKNLKEPYSYLDPKEVPNAISI